MFNLVQKMQKIEEQKISFILMKMKHSKSLNSN